MMWCDSIAVITISFIAFVGAGCFRERLLLQSLIMFLIYRLLYLFTSSFFFFFSALFSYYFLRCAISLHPLFVGKYGVEFYHMQLNNIIKWSSQPIAHSRLRREKCLSLFVCQAVASSLDTALAIF
ncbi:hypothetical protein, unlikely [Trypanosoma brucei gambiense DAL972]|uniref:Uncharacterized protein n=1 Tax=Trypanosoma brucei gambiense (strain MHOM/CI/86/DAL972) TaxID=679716 RepID=D0A2A7_TRYB9|nr:hypothetical protein, unlikely [Trypanosoma brucei gambiense DAL972]CBH15401.1 hypothetical protein, unlikely [Trypanosoma brucei gambiense DAL972]|eukprot:XP_011777665.1 hypothetical protein, unlikely [Trypanosoma brucei gambiense DAL972]